MVVLAPYRMVMIVLVVIMGLVEGVVDTSNDE